MNYGWDTIWVIKPTRNGDEWGFHIISYRFMCFQMISYDFMMHPLQDSGSPREAMSPTLSKRWGGLKKGAKVVVADNNKGSKTTIIYTGGFNK